MFFFIYIYIYILLSVTAPPDSLANGYRATGRRGNAGYPFVFLSQGGASWTVTTVSPGTKGNK
jgi:hypothetical protein